MFAESVSSIPSLWASMNSWFTPAVLFVLLNLMIGTIAITSSLTTQNHHHQDPAGANRPHPHQLARSPSVLQRLKSISLYSYRSEQPTTNFLKSPETDANCSFAQTLEREQSQLTRSPSVLHRLKSINLYSYVSQEAQAEKTLAQELPRKVAAAAAVAEAEEERIEEDADQFDQGDDDQAQTIDEIYSQLKGGGGRSKSDTKPTAEEPKSATLSRKMKKSASAKSAFAHFEEADVVEARRPATVRELKVKAAEFDNDDEEVDAKADDFINKFKQQLKLQRLDSIIRYKEMNGRGSGK